MCVCVLVVKERRKRQALERRTKEMERLSKKLVKQYDARFIDLASQVTAQRRDQLRKRYLLTMGKVNTHWVCLW